MPGTPETTGSSELSLDQAAAQLTSLLSGPSGPEDKSARASPPEQQSAGTEAPETATQAPAAPEQEASPDTPASESEQAESSETTEDTPDAPAPPQTFKVKIDGQEREVTLEEALKGYSRTEDYTRKTQELAQQRREFEEKELAAVRAERQQYEASLGQLQDLLKASSPPEPTLATSASPEQFAIEWTQWKQHQDRIAQVSAEQARVQAKQAEDAQKGFQQYIQTEQAKLVEALPELKDPEKATTIKKDLSAYAQSRGFTEEELSQVTDHRLVVLLHDAMQGHKQAQATKAKAPEIRNKIEQALAPSQPGARTPTPPKNKLADAKQRLKQTGKVEDAGDALNILLGVG